MDWLDICMELITNGLFPIAMCGGLIYALGVLFTAYREDHKETVGVLQNNSSIMQKLCDKLDNILDERKEN